MENNFIPQYIQCTHCKRTLENAPQFWFDMEKRLCNCCECMKYAEDITICRRTGCQFHRHLNDDFILIDDVIKPTAEPVEDKTNDYNPDMCLKCQNESVKDSFYQLSGKITHISDENRSVMNRIQLRFCGKCYAELVKFIRKDG